RRDNSGLARFLKENAEKMSVDEATLQWCAGKGGVDRGRGDAAMTWTNGSSEKGARFKEKVLPPSSVAGLNDSRLVGLSASGPAARRRERGRGGGGYGRGRGAGRVEQRGLGRRLGLHANHPAPPQRRGEALFR